MCRLGIIRAAAYMVEAWTNDASGDTEWLCRSPHLS
jgi:hypothetical protein